MLSISKWLKVHITASMRKTLVQHFRVVHDGTFALNDMRVSQNSDFWVLLRPNESQPLKMLLRAVLQHALQLI